MLLLNIAATKERLFHKWERIVGKKPDPTVQDIVDVLMREEMRPYVAELIKQFGLHDQLIVRREELTRPENRVLYYGTMPDERELRKETATAIGRAPWEVELDRQKEFNQQEELDFECCSEQFRKSNPSHYNTCG